MPTFQSPQLAYHYTDTNPTALPALLLLHGFTGSSENWSNLVESLSPAVRLIALDLPGHGQTDAPTDPALYAMPSVARDIHALLEHLHIARAHLLGYSMGGRLALYLALQQTRRWHSLILESASPGLRTAAERDERTARDEALADFVEREGIRAFVDRWQALPLFATQQHLPQSVRDAHRAARLCNRPHGLANSLRGMGTGVQPSLWPHLPNLQLPTLLLSGALDPKFTNIANEMAALLPHAYHRNLPGAGHTIHLEQPEWYADVIREWLASR
jgi:2-succinyl-6-hydroxy-2,4-cyclohexadiene-1-carboxylate synthase